MCGSCSRADRTTVTRVPSGSGCSAESQPYERMPTLRSPRRMSATASSGLRSGEGEASSDSRSCRRRMRKSAGCASSHAARTSRMSPRPSTSTSRSSSAVRAESISGGSASCFSLLVHWRMVSATALLMRSVNLRTVPRAPSPALGSSSWTASTVAKVEGSGAASTGAVSVAAGAAATTTTPPGSGGGSIASDGAVCCPCGAGGLPRAPPPVPSTVSRRAGGLLGAHPPPRKCRATHTGSPVRTPRSGAAGVEARRRMRKSAGCASSHAARTSRMPPRRGSSSAARALRISRGTSLEGSATAVARTAAAEAGSGQPGLPRAVWSSAWSSLTSAIDGLIVARILAKVLASCKFSMGTTVVTTIVLTSATTVS